jgi:hypothetical protein
MKPSPVATGLATQSLLSWPEFQSAIHGHYQVKIRPSHALLFRQPALSVLSQCLIGSGDDHNCVSGIGVGRCIVHFLPPSRRATLLQRVKCSCETNVLQPDLPGFQQTFSSQRPSHRRPTPIKIAAVFPNRNRPMGHVPTLARRDAVRLLLSRWFPARA